MSQAQITREAVLEAARAELRPGISNRVAVILGYAKVAGQPLDVWGFDDAATILRAERLMIEGIRVSEAVATAREEFTTWGTALEENE